MPWSPAGSLPAGPTGPQGPAGPTGMIRGWLNTADTDYPGTPGSTDQSADTPTAGDIWIVPSPVPAFIPNRIYDGSTKQAGDAVVYNGTSWYNSGPEQGPVGQQGPQGPQGSAGTAGAQGAQGPTGATGATGPQGTAGAQGPAGATGPQGTAGAAGARGSLWFVGNGVPTTVAGSQNGDWYLDLDTRQVYQLTA